MFEVNTVELQECITEDLRIGNTPMVTSSPGMGKSDIIRNVAEIYGLKVIDLRVSQCEPVDMQGYPGVVDGRMTFLTEKMVGYCFLMNLIQELNKQKLLLNL